MKTYICKFSLCFTLSLLLLSTIAKAQVLTSSSTTCSEAETINFANKEDSNINNTEVVQVFNRGQDSLYITQNDIELLAKLVYAESRGEPFEGKIAVASVVLNRVLNPKFPDSINAVIFQSNAFSCVQNGNIVAYPDQSCYNAVYEAIKGKDPSNQALFYYNPEIATCSWMKQTEKHDSTYIGNHIFFKA